MAEEENKWIEAISKLIKLTQKGKLEWKTASGMEFPESKTDNEKIYSVFVTTYNDKNLRIYKRTYLTRVRTLRSALQLGLGPRETEDKWVTKVILEIVNDIWKAAWTFPDEEIQDDLLAAVEYQVAGVKEFLEDIFSEE